MKQKIQRLENAFDEETVNFAFLNRKTQPKTKKIQNKKKNKKKSKSSKTNQASQNNTFKKYD